MKVIVVGAGVAGLSLAARLALRGFEVHVYDCAEKVGGKMYQYTNEDNISWDTGPTLISLPQEIRNTFQDLNYPCPQLIPLKENCHLIFSNGTEWKIPVGQEKIIAFFNAQDKTIGKQLERVLYTAKSIYNFAEQSFFHNAPPSFFKIGLSSLTSGFIFQNSKVALTPYNQVVDSFTKDKNLREFLYHFSSYVGLLPEVAQGGILSIAHVELGCEIVFPQGGVYTIAQALYEACLKYKVKFFLNSKIISAHKETHNNTTYWQTKANIQGKIQDTTYNIVVSNSDPFVASLTWLKEPSIANEFCAKLARNSFTPSESQFVILFDWLDSSVLAHHTKLFPESFKASFEEVYKHKKIPLDPCIYLVWPHATDKSVSPRVLFISAMAPNTQAEYIWDESFSRQYAEKIVNICRQKLKLPLLGKIFKTISPAELETRAQSLHGGIYSAGPTKFNPMHFQFAGHFNLNNIYFVGAGVHPGAGVTMVMKSARRIAASIIKQYTPRK